MTEYRLPEEPPVGSRVVDRDGDVWTASNREWVTTAGGLSRWLRWYKLIQLHGPLTLIEPDPWPTAPLIVATREGKHLTTARRLWRRVDDVRGLYRSVTDIHEAHPGDTLTNVVPVTMVPTERVDYLTAALASWQAGQMDDGAPLWGHAVCPDSVDALAHGDACGTCWLVKPCDCEEGDLS